MMFATDNNKELEDTHQVWAVGSVLCVGAAIIWKDGQSAANPPGGS